MDRRGCAMMSGTGSATSLCARTIRLIWGTAATTTPVSPIDATASTARNRSRRNTDDEATGRYEPTPGSALPGPAAVAPPCGSDRGRHRGPVGLDPPGQGRAALQTHDERVPGRRTGV